MSRIIPAALVAAALAIAAPAAAEDGIWRAGQGLVVKAHGLDLARVDGRAELLRRVEFAAERLCRGQSPQTRRRACAEARTHSAVAAAAPDLQRAFAQALAERQSRSVASR